jgi:hypothetical protein
MTRPYRAGWRVLLTAASAALVLAAGVGIGRSLQPPARAVPVPCVDDILEQAEDADKSSAALVEVLNDMTQGRAGTDSASISILRDSMQDLAVVLSNIRSQVETLKRTGDVRACSAPR